MRRVYVRNAKKKERNDPKMTHARKIRQESRERRELSDEEWNKLVQKAKMDVAKRDFIAELARETKRRVDRNNLIKKYGAKPKAKTSIYRNVVNSLDKELFKGQSRKNRIRKRFRAEAMKEIDKLEKKKPDNHAFGNIERENKRKFASTEWQNMIREQRKLREGNINIFEK